MAKPRVVTLGDLVADLVIPVKELPIRPQGHQAAREIALEPGGTGNFLVIAARLGMEATALGAAGQDYYGQQVLQMLAAEGVNVTQVVSPSGSQTTISLVLVDDNAQHAFIGKFATGTPLPFDPEWRQIIEQSDAVFTSGYALQSSAGFTTETVLKCLELARAKDIPTFFDLGPMAFIVNRVDAEAAIARTTVLLATADEASAWLNVADPLEAARRLQAQGPSTVVIKLGAGGCLIISDEQHIQVDAFPVAVRDTAGAGDAFDAAYAYGVVKGLSLKQTGLLANAVGASSVAKLGTGTRLPRKQEVAQLLRDHGHAVALD